MQRNCLNVNNPTRLSNSEHQLTSAGPAVRTVDASPAGPNVLTTARRITLASRALESPIGEARRANRLLRILQREAPDEYARLDAVLEDVELPREHVLFEPGEPIEFVHFPEGCVASLVKIMQDERGIEVGTTGIEGLSGFHVFFGASVAPARCFVQVGGQSRRVRSAAFADLCTPGSALSGILQRYTLYFFNQTAQSLACNGLHTIGQRCARWLLMTHDRVAGGDTFEMKQEFLALMLGVRRASVSEAAEDLQQAGLIRYSRGKITIEDRAGLEAASCECYRSDRNELERLLPLASGDPSMPMGSSV